MPDRQHVTDAYRTHSAVYIDLFGSVDAMHTDDLAVIADYLAVEGLVLDVGCGPGHLTAHLSSLGVNALGIDVVPEFITHAVEMFGPQFAVGSLLHLPVADKSVNGLLCWYSLIHLAPSELDAVLRQLQRVAAPGCVIVIGFFPGDEVAPFDHKVTTAHFWPIDELSARLRSVGFDEVARDFRPGVAETGTRAHAVIVASRAL